ncbi:MAG: DUF799 domain-containing protein [Gammaproteobacteria bacterium]
MIGNRLIRGMSLATTGAMLAACAAAPYDYTNFRRSPPRSILVLPPLNESTTVEATYGYLSTVTMPLAEMGYYVFPVAVIDQFFKENGMPSAGEMHQAPLDKIREIVGADAVLYVTVERYGTDYLLISSNTIVRARARLVDTRSGSTLWEGVGIAQEGSGGSGNPIADAIAAVVTQVINTATDRAHDVSRLANFSLLTPPNRGLLYGPYHPEYHRQP